MARKLALIVVDMQEDFCPPARVPLTLYPADPLTR